MNSFDSALQKSNRDNLSLRYVPDRFEILVPVSALPLILLLLIILPLFLLTAESLLTPVYEYVASVLMPVNVNMDYTHFPFVLLLKLVLFLFFTFTGVTMLLLKITCIYHEVWCYFLPKPHPEHVDYHPDQQESMVGLLNWSIFRWFKVIGPLLGWFALGSVVMALGYWWFNASTSFDKGWFQFQVAAGVFAFTVFGFLVFVSIIKGLYRLFISIMGDVVAITEPEKATQVVFERSRRLSFMSPWSYLLYPVYFVFYLTVLVEVGLLIGLFDIYEVLIFDPAIVNILAVELLTFVVFIILSGLKLLTYHDALSRYYKRYVG